MLAIVNANARRSSARSVVELCDALPKADVVFSRTVDEARRAFERHGGLQRPLLLCGGGDGTVTSLVNLMEHDRLGPPVGVLALGTGNGLAHALRSGPYLHALRRLPNLPLPPPTLHYDLVSVEGRRSHFAGTGWDARVIADYQRVLGVRGPIPRRLRESVLGYLYGLFRYTVPEEYRLLREQGQARVEITNLGPSAWTVDDTGRAVPLPGGETGRVIHEGPISVASAATSQEWGFHFRAHPHARLMPGWLNLRVYDRPVLEAVRNASRLWRGLHPQPGMHDYFVQRARMHFSRPVPFQIGGDPVGARTELDFSVAESGVRLVDWAQRPR